MTAIALNPKTAEGIALPNAPAKQVEQRDEKANSSPGGPKLPTKSLKKVALAVSALIILLGACFVAYNGISRIGTVQDTDDAYVTGHLHQVSTRISGTVDRVLVDDNQHVEKDQVLVVLDGRDFQIKVDRALSALRKAERQAAVAKSSIQFASETATGQDITARGSVSNAESAIARAEQGVKQAFARLEAAKSDVGARQAERARAEADFNRFQSLSQEGAVSKQQADLARRDFVVAEKAQESAVQRVHEAEATYQQAIESVSSARAALTQSKGQLQLAKASSVQTNINQGQYEASAAAIDEARVALKEAQLNLSYTTITAPTSGRIGKKAVETGQRVEPGQSLLTIVSDDVWVVANFKETQLAQMQPGQKVGIKVDSFPAKKFEGTVDSVAPGSGSSFSVLPSDNATGNFTKIVQRVPVKILFDEKSLGIFKNRLVPGMSAVVDVAVAHK